MTEHASRRQQELLNSPRWQWLKELLRIWYARPLAAADGCSPDELADISARLGVVPPTVLTEWFELVGHRLESIQDAPATLGTLRARDGLLGVWTENQAVWTLYAGEGTDPECEIDSPDFSFPAVSLSRALHGMAVSDTLVGAWGGEGRGPLGQLASTVIGGVIEDITADEAEHVLSAFPRLDVPGNPFHGVPPHGDGATVLREGAGLEWAVATTEAYGRIEALVPLEPLGGRYRVRLELPMTDARKIGLIGTHGIPDVGAVHIRATEPGWPTTASSGPLSASIEWETARPEGFLSAVRDALPESVQASAVISYRPERVARWRVVESSDSDFDAG